MPDLPVLTVHCQAPIGALSMDVAFRLHEPWTVLFGPSGSGKSSLLRLIAGLWMPRDAAVQLGEEDLTGIPAHLRRVGLVAQQPALFPHLDVKGNVRFGATETSAREAMHLLGIETSHTTAIARLSGGERQRVALARAVAARPRLLLLDEVFTGMHRAQRTDLLQRTRVYCAQHSIMVLSVTHDVAEALACADEALRINAGRIDAQGDAHTVLAEERALLLRHMQAR